MEAYKTHPLVPVDLLVETSVGHQAGPLVRLLRAGEVLSGAFVVVVTLEASMAVGASVALTAEAMEEAAGKPKE